MTTTSDGRTTPARNASAVEQRSTERGLGVPPLAGLPQIGSPESPSSNASRRSGPPPLPKSRHEEPAIDESLQAHPVEIVEPSQSTPRVYLYAPSGVRVQLNSVTEAPPPVQITYAPGATRAIPFRIAAPLGIIVFAAGAMVVLLVARGSRSSAGATGISAPMQVEPAAAVSADGKLDLPAPSTDATEPAASIAPDGPETATAPSSSLPVLLMDLPADDPTVPRRATGNAGNTIPTTKKPGAVRPTSGKAKPRFDNPD